MENPFRKALIASAAIFMVIFALSFSLVACDESQIRKAATASDRMALLIASGIDVKRELRAEGLIDVNEDRAVSSRLLDLNRAVTQFNERARAYQSLTPTARSELLTLFKDVTGSLRTLNDDGIFHIRNPDAQKRLSTILTALNEAAGLISKVLGYG